MTPQDATRSLTNRKNHYYAGRRLNVQVSHVCTPQWPLPTPSTPLKMRPSDPVPTETRSNRAQPPAGPNRTMPNGLRMAKTPNERRMPRESDRLTDRTVQKDQKSKAATRKPRQHRRRINEERDGRRRADRVLVRLWLWPSEKRSVLSKERERRLSSTRNLGGRTCNIHTDFRSLLSWLYIPCIFVDQDK